MAHAHALIHLHTDNFHQIYTYIASICYANCVNMNCINLDICVFVFEQTNWLTFLLLLLQFTKYINLNTKPFTSVHNNSVGGIFSIPFSLKNYLLISQIPRIQNNNKQQLMNFIKWCFVTLGSAIFQFEMFWIQDAHEFFNKRTFTACSRMFIIKSGDASFQ